MNSGVRKAFGAGVLTLIVAAELVAPSFAFAGCRHDHRHCAFGLRGWPDQISQVSSYWRPRGYGCGPFADNEDGWDIGWAGRCYFPVGY